MPITHWLYGPDDFQIAHFTANYHGKTLGNFERYDPIANFAMTTAQTWVMRKVVSKMCHFEAIFLLQIFFQPTSDCLWPQVLYMDGKLSKWGFFWCIGRKNWSDYMVSRFLWRAPDRIVLYSWDLVLQGPKKMLQMIH